jgi:large subunit ribosomal protein L6
MTYKLIDPLAQSFFIDRPTTITKVDLFFSAKDDTLPAFTHIRKNQNGQPGPYIVPFSEVYIYPDKVNVTIDSTSITVKGPKGELSKNLPTSIKIIQNDKSISVLPTEGLSNSYQLYGTYRSLVSNMITGVTEGFQRKLELQGVGYRSQIDGKTLILNVGYSHQVKILSPEGIKLSVEGNTNVTVSGLDKELVGQIAANIRLVRPPEPYKGKGIRYQGEYVRKKVGKAGKK